VHRVDGGEFIGKIVEVEAYLGPHDLAAHSAFLCLSYLRHVLLHECCY
jgi:3-methyladenine DNA glycosylase Mpg